MSCDVFVAIVRLSSYAVDQLEGEKFKQCHQQMPFSPSSFDLLMALPSTNFRSENNLKTRKVFALPKCKASQREAAEETALRFVRGICRSLCVRAVNVPLAHLDHPLPGCSSSSASYVHRSDSPRLIFIPITPSAVSSDRISDCFEFHSLATILRASANSVGSVDARSQNLVLRIGEWLSLGQCQFRPSAAPFPFLRSLFLTPSASLRILNCVHNPSFDPRQFRFCCQSSTEDKENGRKREGLKGAATELDEEVKRSNALRAEMLRMEKYDKFVINPLFGANIFCQRQITAPRYFVRNHSSKANGQLGGEDTANGKGRGPQQRSPTEFWEQQYPLHKHAFDGNAERIRELLAQGDDPNEQDNDLWTPLHYCAFYNRLEACETLLLHPRTNVNVVNGTGATPLHFAALNGNIYVAELILSHQLADINIRDATGKTPLDLCVLVPKSDWRGVAFLLKQKQPAKLTKVEVQLIGAPSLQVEVDDAQKVTAKELRTKVLQMEGVDSELGARIFAIWLMDSRLSLQLKAEQNVNVHLDKWTEHLDKFGSDSIGDGGGEERVKIVLKRDARTLLGDEQMLARKSAAVTSLLYGEAEAEFLRGFYPCHEKHYVPMAAIVAHRIYGAEWPSNTNSVFLSHVLPRHLVPSAGTSLVSLLAKLRHAHHSLVGLSLIQLQLHFLNLCWSLNVYGCTFFRAFMLMSKPLRGNLQIFLGLNDWGICMINATTHRQVASIEMDKLEVKFTPNTNYLEVANRRKDLMATVTSSQAVLINNLLKQLRLKVGQANKTHGNNDRHN